MALTKVDPVHGVELADTEYFHVDLTTAQTGLTDNTTVNVDFGGSGTVKYDTKSNFDSTNDAYLLDSSDGVYLISYSVGVRSASLTSEAIVDAVALLRVATDGSTFSPVQGSAAHPQDENANENGSLTLNNTFIYKATTATTKIDLQAYVNASGGNNWAISDDIDDLQAGLSGTSGANCTFLSIVRIA
jgi:hypothetical protein